MKTVKRFTLFLLVMLLFCSAASADAQLRGYSREEGYVYLSLGRYPQTADGGVLPILWRVLSVDDEKAYLCSEYILFARCIHSDLKEYRDVFRQDFSRTELCEYLNTVFAGEAFTEEEMDLLLPCENFGRVFLLTAKDMENKSYGLGLTHVGKVNSKKVIEEPGLRAWGTEWAIENNGFDPVEYPDKEVRLVGSSKKEMPLAELRLYVFRPKYGSHSPYWSRTPSTSDARHARCVKDGGQLGHIEVGRDNEGVRPALYLALNNFRIVGGDGSKGHPYQIAPLAQSSESEASLP